MLDRDVTEVFDYLGSRQPLGRPNLALTTSGGGGVTAPVTPSVPERVGAARAISMRAAMGEPSGSSTGQDILKGVGLGKTAFDWAQKIAGLFPTDTPAPPLGGGGIEGATTGAAGSLPALSAEAAAAAGEQGALAAGEAAGSSIGGAAGAVGSVLPYLGGALMVAQDIMSNKSKLEKGLDVGIDVATTAAAPFTLGLSALAAPALKSVAGREIQDFSKGDWLQAIIDQEPIMSGIHAIEDMFKGGGPFGLFGSPGLSHAQREAKDLATHIAPGAVGFQNSLAKAPSLDALWSAIVAGGSGTTGGTSPVATSVSLPMSHEAFAAAVKAGEIALPGGQSVEKFIAAHGDKPLSVAAGQPNGSYPVFTQQGFFKALEANAGSLHTGVQAGVEPGQLAPMNEGLARTILQQYAHLKQQQASAMPRPTMPTMPSAPPSTPGPEGGLGFSRDLTESAA